jgi:hypothetical protein
MHAGALQSLDERAIFPPSNIDKQERIDFDSGSNFPVAPEEDTCFERTLTATK